MAEVKTTMRKVLKSPYSWLAGMALLCWWPLTFGLFSVKNDNLVVFLALRYNISEAIQSGNLPFWSPYINLGFPIHADLQSGAWNPVVLFLSLFGRYNISMLHAETILYTFLAGAGMYKLLCFFKTHTNTAFVFAFAYMVCGYISDVGGNNILFLASASYLPFVFCYALKTFRSYRSADALKTAVAFYFLFTSAYPFFFVAALYIVLTGALVSVITSAIHKNSGIVLSCFRMAALTGISFLLISLPALISYYELLPFYERGSDISLARTLQNSLELKSLSSYLLPQWPMKNTSLESDITMRNAYVGLVPLVLFMIWLFSKGKRKETLWFFAGVLFFFLYSLGPLTPVREWAYHFMPLMNYFRHPANARLLVSIGLLIIAVPMLQKVEPVKLNKLVKGTAAAIGIILIALLFMNNTGSSAAFHWPQLTSRLSIRELLNNLETTDYFLICIIIQLISIGAIIALSERKLINGLLVVTALNSFVFFQLSLPVTQVSSQSPSAINVRINNFPHGYPLPSLNHTIAENTVNDNSSMVIIGNENYYNKKPGFPEQNYNPTILTKTETLINDSTAFHGMMELPVAYLSGTGSETSEILPKSEGSKLSFVSFNNNQFSFSVNADKPVNLCLQQNLLPGWKFELDHQSEKLYPANIAFMFARIPPGVHQAKFTYQPAYLIPAIIIALLAWMILMYLTGVRSHDKATD